MKTAREICKISVLQLFTERCAAWFNQIKCTFSRQETWKSHLTEYYCLYEQYSHNCLVQEWINQRAKQLNENRYRMVIKHIDTECPPDTIGHVLLYSQGRFIHEATLKIKEKAGGNGEPLKENERYIYWSFKKEGE